jgi:hypothetical protein
MSLDMPQSVARYFESEKSADTDVIPECFAQDAVVHDEGRTFRGVDAIKAWKSEAKAKYRYTAEVLAASQSGDRCLVRARLTGDFAGSPIELSYAFTLRNDRISTLEIGNAQ